MSCSHTFLSQAVEAAWGGGPCGRARPASRARRLTEGTCRRRRRSTESPRSGFGYRSAVRAVGSSVRPSVSVQFLSERVGRTDAPLSPNTSIRGRASPLPATVSAAQLPLPVSLRFSRRAGRPFSSRDALLNTTPDPGTGEAQVPLQVTAAAPPHTQCPPHRTPQPRKSAGLHDPPQTTGRAAHRGAATGRLWQ